MADYETENDILQEEEKDVTGNIKSRHAYSKKSEENSYSKTTKGQKLLNWRKFWYTCRSVCKTIAAPKEEGRTTDN